jgi:isocitrate dehydrogenase kinase/phosphatase
MRTIKTHDEEDWSISSDNGPEADELFTDPTLVNAVIDLIKDRATNGETVAIVSAEWERKTAIVRSPLNEESPSYRSARDDIIVSVELRLGDWEQRDADVQQVLTPVQAELTAREEQREAASVAELESQRAALAQSLSALDTELAKRRTGVKLAR